MPFALAPAVPVVWNWLVTSTLGRLSIAYVSGRAFNDASDYLIRLSREAELEDYLVGNELARSEEEMLTASLKVTQHVDDIVNTFDASTVNPSDYVPQAEEIQTPELIIPASGTSLLEVLKDSNHFKQQELELMQASHQLLQEQNRKLVNQNEILYKQTVEMMEHNKLVLARLTLDKAHTPVISRAAVQQAANVKAAREQTAAVQSQETVHNISNIVETPQVNVTNEVPVPLVSVSNEVSTPQVNVTNEVSTPSVSVTNEVSTPQVNVQNQVDTTPIATAVSSINKTLTPLSDNAVKQRQIADYQLTPRTVLDSEGKPLFVGTPLDIQVARDAAQAKNHTDEAEFEFDEDLLSGLTGLEFKIPEFEYLESDDLIDQVKRYMGER